MQNLKAVTDKEKSQLDTQIIEKDNIIKRFNDHYNIVNLDVIYCD